MFLSSQRIQSIHDQPAQYAGSDFLYKTQPAQYAGWAGTVCREDRHNMPIFSFLILPLHISPFLMCVDKVHTRVFTHIETKESQEVEIKLTPTIEPKLNTGDVLRKKTWKPKKQDENDIPTNMLRKLSDILRDVLNRDFVDNDDCKMIIQTVTSNRNKTIEEFRLMMIELPNYDPSLIFNSNLILKDRKIRRNLNAAEVAKNLENWITSKEELIAEYDTSKKAQEEFEKQKELAAKEFLIKEEAERKNREILKLEKERLSKEKDQQDFEKLPEDFKEWFQKLPSFHKKEFKKEIRKHGPETFSNEIIPTIIEYQNYYNKNYKLFNDSQNIAM